MQQGTFTLDLFLDSLHQFAARNFPVQETHRFLQQSLLLGRELDPYLFFVPDRYTRNLIYKSAEFELLAICWQPGQSAPIHGHEGEKCWARVERGALRFTNYREQPSTDSFSLVITAPPKIGGPGYLDGPADIHSVENASQESAVSLHLYARPYESCEIYDLESHCKQRIKLGYFSKFGKLEN